MINTNTIKRNAGYTIDQTILIVAIIAILITIIIATVGWDLINRAGGAKLAAQFRQVEDAIGLFYASHNQWPYEAIDITAPTTTAADGRDIALALTGQENGNSFNTSIQTADIRNHVPGFSISGTVGSNATLQHDFGAGGDIRIFPMRPPSSTGLGDGTTSPMFMVIKFDNVPAPEVHEADEAIDGSVDAVIGRVWYGTACLTGGSAADTTSSRTKATVCYAANLIQ